MISYEDLLREPEVRERIDRARKIRGREPLAHPSATCCEKCKPGLPCWTKGVCASPKCSTHRPKRAA